MHISVKAWVVAGFTGAMLSMAAAAAPAMAASVTQSNLTSDGAVAATFTDKNLVNGWGMAYSPTGNWWLSDNGTGLTTVYDGTGKLSPAAKPLVVTIPPPAGQTGHSSPTGQVYNPNKSINITSGGKTGAATFIFVTEDGTISGWNTTVNATTAITTVDNSAGGTGAVYKGVALSNSGGTPSLLVANFRSGMIEVYNSSWVKTNSFRDTALPANYSPFNVAVLNGQIFVAYAVAATGGFDDVPGAGHGALELIDITGKVLGRLKGGVLNSPWGMAIAPSSWGTYAGSLLVANFGDGRISGINLTNGHLIGQLPDSSAKPISIDGLWGIMPGNGSGAGATTDMYFTAGPNGEANGLFGKLTFNP